MTTRNNTTIPNHLGLVLDGNRRWAKNQGLPTLEGHRKGYENLKTIALAAFEKGVQYVSAFVFSTENWNRSKEEVDYLMKLLIWVAKNEIKELDKKNVRVRFIGTRKRLSKDVLNAIDDAENRTASNTGGTLVLCLNYGGQQEIIDAVNTIITQDDRHPLSVNDFEKYLYGPDIPPVDLIIRTSGEQRISNFMLWRAAYSELFFVDNHWPDFSESDLTNALENYSTRHRRFGK